MGWRACGTGQGEVCRQTNAPIHAPPVRPPNLVGGPPNPPTVSSACRLVVAVHFVPRPVVGLRAVAGVMEKERVARLRTRHQLRHRVEHLKRDGRVGSGWNDSARAGGRARPGSRVVCPCPRPSSPAPDGSSRSTAHIRPGWPQVGVGLVVCHNDDVGIGEAKAGLEAIRLCKRQGTRGVGAGVRVGLGGRTACPPSALPARPPHRCPPPHSPPQRPPCTWRRSRSRAAHTARPCNCTRTAAPVSGRGRRWAGPQGWVG